MLKKSIILGLGFVLLTTVSFGRNAVSYFTTTVGKVKQGVRDSIPIEFEIDRARTMIADLRKPIRENMHLIAKEEIQIQHLNEQLEGTEKQLSKDRTDIMQLKSALGIGKDHIQLANHLYSKNEVKTDLANRFYEYKTNDSTTRNLRKVLVARRKGLSAAREKLNGMLAARKQLQVDVENLEARLKMVQVAQSTSDFNFDDSHLARTKELIRDIRTRLEVGEKLIQADHVFHDRIPLEEPEIEDISEQITEYFGASKKSDHSDALAEVSRN